PTWLAHRFVIALCSFRNRIPATNSTVSPFRLLVISIVQGVYRMMRRVFLLAIFLLLSSTPLLAQKRAFTIEDLYRVKNISDLHISPDGKTVIFALGVSDLAHAKKNTHIWAMNLDGTNLRQLTTGEKSESSPLWSPD